RLIWARSRQVGNSNGNSSETQRLVYYLRNNAPRSAAFSRTKPRNVDACVQFDRKMNKLIKARLKRAITYAWKRRRTVSVLTNHLKCPQIIFKLNMKRIA